ncbi:uncharacterized protein V1510DRAFT_183167 [Dipodascopsis tothii]|uniref:uncharacterized protein n=1 Tax=Dipodascopsis tothii TaxID=44089 RepID=UPI0034CF26DF
MIADIKNIVALGLLAQSALAMRPSEKLFEGRHANHKEKRGTTKCEFPTDLGLVSVTPGSSNGGWAMSPDQECTAGSWCPYACPPGQLSAQWDPDATTYSYPESMYGGLKCNDDGTVSKGFSSKPYCYDGTGTVTAESSAGSVAFCQTVLPGNEAMLIPTEVDGSTTLAVPDTSYWDGTAAHYYVNPPGVSTDDGCVWGSTANPYGNWAPYVAGANTDASGITYVKVGWNPVYLEDTSPFKNTIPDWGINITCPDGGCSGLPCGIDTSEVNGMYSSSTGAGGGNFCVVGVEAGKKATIQVYSGSSSGGSSSSSSSSSSSTKSSSSSTKASSASATSSSSSSSSSAAAESSGANNKRTVQSTTLVEAAKVSSAHKHKHTKPAEFGKFGNATANATATNVTTTAYATETVVVNGKSVVKRSPASITTASAGLLVGAVAAAMFICA